jgi:proteasome assembly chaperone (PAC2) family protein
MGIRLYQEPQLENPILVASWPGIGNIGIVAVDTLKGILEAEEFGEIEPWEFFYPKRVLIRKGILEYLEFPSSKFYFKRIRGTDIIFFIGEEQPTEGGRMYAEGRKAYRMADLVLDVAEKFRCRRVYTSGAAVALIHHTTKPRVWAVPNGENLVSEIKAYQNTVLMSDIEGRGGHGSITGLNGLLLGVAKKRGFEAICLMGEIPVYLQGLPLSYPKASKSVLEVLSHSLKVEVNLDTLDELDRKVEQKIEEFYQQIPLEIRGQLDRLKHAACPQPAEPGPITEEEEKRIMEDVEKFFRKRGGGG